MRPIDDLHCGQNALCPQHVMDISAERFSGGMEQHYIHLVILLALLNEELFQFGHDRRL